MLSELFSAISKQAVSAAHPELKIQPHPGNPRVMFAVQGEKKEEIDVPPPLRSHEVLGLQDFIEAAQRWGGSGDDSGSMSGVVWHNESMVWLVVDDEDRRDVVFMRLPYSEQFGTILDLSNGFGKPQREFVKLLRHDLAGCVPEGLLLKVRKVQAGTTGTKAGDIQHGREKGTMEFSAELVNAADIEESIIANVAVYTASGLQQKHAIEMTLDIDPKALTFALAPLPDEITIAVQDAQRALHAELAEKLSDMTVLYGDPHLPVQAGIKK